MRKVTVQQSNGTECSEERLVRLLAAGLERLLEKKRAQVVDLAPRESVTTTCPDVRGEQDE